MRFLDWMSTPPGRVLRVFLGVVLIALGLSVVQGIAGVAMAVFGLVPLTTAIVNVCPIRPLVELCSGGGPTPLTCEPARPCTGRRSAPRTFAPPPGA